MNKEYIDKRFDETLGVIREVLDVVNTRMSRMETKIDTLENRVNTLETNDADNKMILLRIEHALQDKQEAQGDEIQILNQRVERIEDHLKLPRSLSVAA